jgi:acyl-CoA oxidase
MLMGVARVTPEGKYERVPGGDKLAYGAMLDVRATLVMKASFSLGRAVTIAVRYSAVRQQGFRQGSSMEEVQVLDYPTQQRVLMPLLAYAFVLHFTGESMRRVYHKYLETLDGSLLPDLHATSSGLKALVTQSVADGIEAARKMCGGHGYLLSSGLPEASFNYLALPTLEGTQQVLEPQTARHMLRSLEAGRSGKRLGLGVAYLADSSHFECPDLSVPGALLHMDLLVKLFQERSRKCAAALERSVSAAGGGAVGMAKCGVEAGRAARGHCQLHILQCAVGSVEEIEARQPAVLNAPELRALKELVITYALWVIDLDMGDFREEGLLSDRAADAVRLELGSLCARLRTEAVALTDAFHFSDKYLGSDLGRYDGHVYDALYETALQEPLNAEDVAESYQYVKKLVGVAPGLRL